MAPVCRRFYQLSCAPELLRDVRFAAHGVQLLPKSRAFLPWLARRATHVRQLMVELALPDAATDAERSELVTLLDAYAAACGAAGQLEELSVGYDLPLGSLSWLPVLCSLRRLYVDSSVELQLSVDVSSVPLQELELACETLSVAPSARLPASLTKFGLWDSGSRKMPQQARWWAVLRCTRGSCVADAWQLDQAPAAAHAKPSLLLLTTFAPVPARLASQLARLPNLRRLEITSTNYSSDSMAPLSALTGLSCLKLDDVTEVPPAASLAALTALQRLHVMATEPFPAEQLNAALPALRQLTSLAVGRADSVPPAVGSLAQLQQLCIWRTEPPAAAPHSLHPTACTACAAWALSGALQLPACRRWLPCLRWGSCGCVMSQTGAAWPQISGQPSGRGRRATRRCDACACAHAVSPVLKLNHHASALTPPERL